MTNKEKFKEIFGVEPDDTSMILTCPHCIPACKWYDDGCHCEDWWNTEYKEPTPKENNTRQIKEICISYPKLAMKEHDGKPYYTVKYIENGEEYEGYGTYKIEVFMRYLRDYFMPAPASYCKLEDCIPRSTVYTLIKDIKSDIDDGYGFQFEDWVDEVRELPSVLPKAKTPNYTWDDLSSVMDAMEYETNSLIENIKSEIMHFANAHCSGDDINIYDVLKVIDDCCENKAQTKQEPTPKENVNHPKHYNISGRKECIEEMIDIYGVDAVITFCHLNAYKYRYRHELKNGQEDLEKAKWYEDYAEKLKGAK